jgi:hypothetical protein
MIMKAGSTAQKENFLDKGKMTDNRRDFLLAFYSATQSEITRYRDREWATPGIFVTALGAIVGFIISNEQEARNLWLAFDIILILLASGNAFYTIYVHNRLTKQRNVRARLEYLFELHRIKVNKNSLVPFKVEQPQDDNFYTGWFNGFWSHILPFILLGVGLCCFGIWLLHHGQ